ncbi:hypothetical protein KXS07_35755 [Inquilinus limosus]|uniref:HalD/BesD family halogenase n=1 Tax=Inquilinus limosus TaxID=171674 RepID=UPI003F15A7BA
MFRSDLYAPNCPLADELKAHYQKLHHAAFPGFVDEDFFPELKRDVDALLDHAMRRDFLMECMENSPRRMNVVNGHTIERLSRFVPAIYRDNRILDFLTYVVGEQVIPLEDDIDRFVINQLSRSSDTFGAHYDDYPLSFVIIVESPGVEGGGYAEMVPNGALSDLEVNPIRLPLRARDAYILKTDTTAHRVAPLKIDALRTAINLAYTTPGFVPRYTESASKLYAEET